jgi:hypothetical protein
VVAAGTPPLRYQWYFNTRSFPTQQSQPGPARRSTLGGRNLTRCACVTTRRCVESAGHLDCHYPVAGGGTLFFVNRFLRFTHPPTKCRSSISMAFTRLNGPTFVAQLYAGPSLDSLASRRVTVSVSQRFRCRLFCRPIRHASNVPPGATALAQVRAWEITPGVQLRRGRALAENSDARNIFEVVAGGDALPPAHLYNLKSFQLQAGLPSLRLESLNLWSASRVESWSGRCREPAGSVMWSKSFAFQ